MNGNEFQNYILGFIFYKFLSEKVTLLADDALEGAGFCYAELTPEIENYNDYLEVINAETHEALGYVLAPGQIFGQLIAQMKNDSDAFIINELQATLDSIEASTRGTDAADDFVNLFEDMDLNSSKLGKTPEERNAMIKDILLKLSEIDFRLDDTESDVLGDSYEFLISKFAATSGSAAGEFYIMSSSNLSCECHLSLAA